MKNTLLKILSILGLFLSPLVLMADDVLVKGNC